MTASVVVPTTSTNAATSSRTVPSTTASTNPYYTTPSTDSESTTTTTIMSSSQLQRLRSIILNAYLEPLLQKHASHQDITFEDLLASKAAADQRLATLVMVQSPPPPPQSSSSSSSLQPSLQPSLQSQSSTDASNNNNNNNNNNKKMISNLKEELEQLHSTQLQAYTEAAEQALLTWIRHQVQAFLRTDDEAAAAPSTTQDRLVAHILSLTHTKPNYKVGPQVWNQMVQTVVAQHFSNIQPKPAVQKETTMAFSASSSGEVNEQDGGGVLTEDALSVIEARTEKEESTLSQPPQEAEPGTDTGRLLTATTNQVFQVDDPALRLGITKDDVIHEAEHEGEEMEEGEEDEEGEVEEEDDNNDDEEGQVAEDGDNDGGGNEDGKEETGDDDDEEDGEEMEEAEETDEKPATVGSKDGEKDTNNKPNPGSGKKNTKKKTGGGNRRLRGKLVGSKKKTTTSSHSNSNNNNNNSKTKTTTTNKSGGKSKIPVARRKFPIKATTGRRGPNLHRAGSSAVHK